MKKLFKLFKLFKKKIKKINFTAMDDKHIASLSYIWILCLIPLLYKPRSRYCQFHAKQGIILFLLSILTILPFFGWICGLVVIFISIMGITKALEGESWKIPYIYEWSKKIS